jgi:glycerol-3-phosphate dehydrogenase
MEAMGRRFGPLLYEAEVRHLVTREWAETAEDILWRRTKHRLHMTAAEQTAFADWFIASELAKSA